MGSLKLTQDEADTLISMLKKSLIAEISFPSVGGEIEFNVLGNSPKDIFTVNVFHSKYNPQKSNYGARINKNGVMLLQLHISPTQVHMNPDGVKILGNHWHLYNEKYNLKFAFPADDLDNYDFVNNTIRFLEMFNVIEKPEILYQLKLF